MAREMIRLSLARLHADMNPKDLGESLHGDGVLDLGEFIELQQIVDNRGKVRGNEFITRTVVQKPKELLNKFFIRLEDQHPDLVADVKREYGQARENPLRFRTDIVKQRFTRERMRCVAVTVFATIVIILLILILVFAIKSSNRTYTKSDPEPSAPEGGSNSETSRLSSKGIPAIVQAKNLARLSYGRDTEDTDYIFSKEHEPSAPEGGGTGETSRLSSKDIPAMVQAKNLARLRYGQDTKESDYIFSKWRHVASIPQDAKGCTAAITNDTVYIRVVRGTPLSAYYFATSLTDINEQSQWTPFHIDLPPPRAERWLYLFSSPVTNVLYAGVTKNLTTDPCTVFMFENNRWTKIAKLPFVRWNAMSTVHHNYLIVVGGQDGKDNPILDIIVLDLLTANKNPVWHTVGALPEWRNNPHLLLDNEHVHVVGGGGWLRDDKKKIITLTLNKNLNPDSDSKTPYTVLHNFLPPTLYSLSTAAIVNGNIVVAGGWKPNTPGSFIGRAVSDVYVLIADGGEKKWMPLPSLKLPVSVAQLFYSHNKLYRITGDLSDEIIEPANFELSHSIEVLEW